MGSDKFRALLFWVVFSILFTLQGLDADNEDGVLTFGEWLSTMVAAAAFAGVGAYFVYYMSRWLRRKGWGFGDDEDDGK